MSRGRAIGLGLVVSGIVIIDTHPLGGAFYTALDVLEILAEASLPPLAAYAVWRWADGRRARRR